jgi:hypothetical protein
MRTSTGRVGIRDGDRGKMTLTTAYVDILLDELDELTSLVNEFDEGSWLLLSDGASTLDPRGRREAMVTARDIAHAHAREPLLDHAIGQIRRAAEHNPAMAVLPDPGTVLEVLDCAIAAIVVADLTAHQHVAVLTEALETAVSQASAALQAQHHASRTTT